MVKRRRKTRTHVRGEAAEAATSGVPKSFIIKSGKVGKSASALVHDVRRTMEPNTATKLRERKSNKLRDFLTMAGPLGVSHMLIFGQTDAGTNMRIIRCPRGPTLTFRVNKYALTKDVLASSRRPKQPSGNEFVTPPLLVLNNFGSEDKHVKLLVTTFQNLFPPIHVQSMKLSSARRIVLLNYNASTRTIDWRHYVISLRPVGVSKAVRRVIEGTTSSSQPAAASSASKAKGKRIVNLANTSDIADYVLGASSRSGSVGGGFETDASDAESEAEDMADPRMKVELSHDYVGRGNLANAQRAVRLREIGPRMELRLIKIEEGMNGGEVLYHDYVKKSATEAAEQSRSHAERTKLTAERRAEQERNVARKKAEKEERRRAARAAQGLPTSDAESGASDAEAEADGEEGDQEDEDDEFEYEDRFADEVEADGQGLDEELFSEGDEQVDSEEEEGPEGEDDDSDLEPIPLGDMQHDYDSDDPWPDIESASEEEEEEEEPERKRPARRQRTRK